MESSPPPASWEVTGIRTRNLSIAKIELESIKIALTHRFMGNVVCSHHSQCSEICLYDVDNCDQCHWVKSLLMLIPGILPYAIITESDYSWNRNTAYDGVFSNNKE